MKWKLKVVECITLSYRLQLTIYTDNVHSNSSNNSRKLLWLIVQIASQTRIFNMCSILFVCIDAQRSQVTTKLIPAIHDPNVITFGNWFSYNWLDDRDRPNAYGVVFHPEGSDFQPDSIDDFRVEIRNLFFLKVSIFDSNECELYKRVISIISVVVNSIETCTDIDSCVVLVNITNILFFERIHTCDCDCDSNFFVEGHY